MNAAILNVYRGIELAMLEDDWGPEVVFVGDAGLLRSSQVPRAKFGVSLRKKGGSRDKLPSSEVSIISEISTGQFLILQREKGDG
jgi:hypothetical protein